MAPAPGDTLYRILAVTDISQPQAPPKRLHTGGRILDTCPAEDDSESRGPGTDRPTRCLKFALSPVVRAECGAEDAIVTAVELEELPFAVADLTRGGNNVLLHIGHRVECSHGVLLLRPSNTRLVSGSGSDARPAEDQLDILTDDDDFLILDIEHDDQAAAITVIGDSQ